MRDFNLGQKTWLLRRQGTGNLFFHEKFAGGEVRKSRQVQIEVALVAVCGSHTFRCGGCGGATSTTTAFIVATLVSSQGLSCREGFLADGALVDLASTVGGRAGGHGGGGGVVLSGGAGEFPVAGLVSAKGLVRGEGFFADRALVTELFSGYRCRTRQSELGCYGGAAASEHDEAESEILFLRAGSVVVMAVRARTLGTLSLRPRCVDHVAVVRFLEGSEGWSGGGW